MYVPADLKQTLQTKKTELSTVRNNADDLLRKREKISESLQQTEKQNRELAERTYKIYCQ